MRKKIMKIIDSVMNKKKQLFKEENEVTFNELTQYLLENYDHYFQKSEDGIDAIIQNLYTLIAQLKDQLKVLRHERAVDIIEKKKLAYITQHAKFMVLLELPEEITYEKIKLMIDRFEEAKNGMSIESLTSDLQLEYPKTIKMISQIVNDIYHEFNTLTNQFTPELMRKMFVLKNKSEYLIKKNNQKNFLEKDLEYENKKLSNAKELKERFERQIEKLGGKTENNLDDTESKQEKIEELKIIIGKIDEYFNSIKTIIERDLKEENFDDKKILQLYYDNSHLALHSDKELKIIEYLDQIKDEKENIDYNLFRKYQELNEEMAKKSKIVKEMKNTKIDDLIYKLEHSKKQVIIQEERIQKIKEKIESLAIEKDIEMIREFFDEIFGVGISIIQDN